MDEVIEKIINALDSTEVGSPERKRIVDEIEQLMHKLQAEAKIYHEK